MDPRSSTRPGTRARRGAVLAVAAGTLAISGCGPDQTPPPDDQEGAAPQEGGGTPVASAAVQDGDGTEVGTAEFTRIESGLEISVNLGELEPGHHGLHVHEMGLCEPDSAAPDDPSSTGDFLSAGGHIAGDSEHPQHPGDLPSLLVTENGTAQMTFVTDRLTEDELLDDDGAALMVHSGADNFANVPERYAPDGPDQDTTDTGDAGDRAACGVIESTSG